MRRMISEEDLAAYKRDGFLIARGLYDACEIRDLSNWIYEIAARTPEPGKQMMYY